MSAVVDYTANIAFIKELQPSTPAGITLKAQILKDILATQRLSEDCCEEYRKSLRSGDEIKAEKMFARLTLRKKTLANAMERIRSLV